MKIDGFSLEMIQDSIHAFAFDLEENGKAEKIKGSPLDFLWALFGKEDRIFRLATMNRQRQDPFVSTLSKKPSKGCSRKIRRAKV